MAPKTIRDRITDKFIELAEGAGLEFVTSGDTWLVMDDSDGLDTRLRIAHTFQADHATFQLTGQAVRRPPLEFFRERKLVRANVGASNRPEPAVQLRAQYEDGEALAKVFGAVRDLLAPYALQPLSSDPQQVRLRMAPPAVVEATRQTHASGAPDDVRYVLTVPGDREPRKLGPVGFEDAAHWAGQSLGNMAVGRELITMAREQGRARAEVGGAYSKLLPADGAQ